MGLSQPIGMFLYYAVVIIFKLKILLPRVQIDQILTARLVCYKDQPLLTTDQSVAVV